MTSLALALVLASAALHATWNLFAKRATGGPLFVWLFSAAATVIYAPLTLIVLPGGARRWRCAGCSSHRGH